MDRGGSGLAGRRAAGAFVVLMTLATAASVATGLLDLVIPAATGGATFAALQAGSARWGPGYTAVHIFLHNLGLACVVPGVGLALLPREPDGRLRRLIPPILYGAVVAALFSGALYAPLRLNAPTLTLFALEATGVLALSLGGYRALLAAAPRPERWPAAALQVTPWFAVSALVLAAAAWYELLLVGAL